MGKRADRGQSKSEGQGSNQTDSREELLVEIVFSDVEDVRREERASIVAQSGNESVAERLDVELGQKSDFGGSNLVSLLDQVHVRDDFHGSLDDLGGNSKGLEEGSLTRVESGRSWRNEHIRRSEGSSSRGSRDLIGRDDVSDVLQRLIGEDESHVAVDVRKELVERGEVLGDDPHHTTDLRVLAHEH